MRRTALAIIASLCVWTSILSAHEVPDRVDIAVFLKPEGDRMRILVRMPANALIDFLLPTLAEGNWLDLANADQPSADGARVWIAEMLQLFEDGAARPKPELMKVRLSLVNDPAFATYDSALTRVNGLPLSPDTLALQEQVTVDALLETPIGSTAADFSFTPRFARLGVLVYTTVTFLPPDGTVHQFLYEGDPATFALNPTRVQTAGRFFRAGVSHYLSDPEYLLFALCVALIFLRSWQVVTFAMALALAESLSLLISLAFQPSASWVSVLSGALVAATTAYAGIEAIVAAGGRRLALAGSAGAILGFAFWSELQPVLQFGGSHTLAAAFAFGAGAILSQCGLFAVAALVTGMLLRLSLAPRAAIVIAAALAIHVSWRRMLDRIDALTLVGMPLATDRVALLTMAAAAVAVTIGVLAFLKRRQSLAPRAT